MTESGDDCVGDGSMILGCQRSFSSVEEDDCSKADEASSNQSVR